MELVATKVNWAQAEEEKDLAWFKASLFRSRDELLILLALQVRDVKKQLQKAHETNRQFAKRMTKLEVSLSSEKQKSMAAAKVSPNNPFS